MSGRKAVLVRKLRTHFMARDWPGAPLRSGAWPSSPIPTTCARRRVGCIIDALLAAGRSVRAYDPVASGEARRLYARSGRKPSG